MRNPRRRRAAPRLAALLMVLGPVALVPAGGAASASTLPGPGARDTGAGQQSGEPAEAIGGPRLASSDVVVSPTAPELPTGLSAASWLIADLDTGQVLAAKDPHGQYAPASTLKTLTALALMPEIDTERRIVPTYDDVAVDGSKVGLVEDVAYPAEELFAAMLMVSGNDAANALATAAGGQEQTAERMNELARDLQALDTRAVNPSGLDADGQVSSAYDLALIARAGLAEPDFARWVATRKSSVGAPAGAPRIETYTKNRLLQNYEGALGIKNGYTVAARASFVGAAEREGRRLVVTLLRADPRVWEEAGRLLDWGFAATTTPAPVGQLVAPVSAAGAALPAPGVVPEDPVVAQLPPSAAVDEGGFPLTGVTVGMLTVTLLVGVRRRQVVVRQRQAQRRREQARRRAAAAAPQQARRRAAAAAAPPPWPVARRSAAAPRTRPAPDPRLPRASGMR